MAARIVQLSKFFSRLKIEGNKLKFTWLIGAGMSASSGIPLATKISHQIVLFEYLSEMIWEGELKNPIPNIADAELKYSNRQGLDAFFSWYDESELSEDYYFETLKQKSWNWLKQQDGFENSNIEDPETYQKLFQHFFQSSTTHHHFLTTIVSRRQGVNLAHLGLAGILKDHPEWGHTVFTTNFDDLLLESIYSLGHTARIFGDLELQTGSDTPSLEPTYPQIVHLHGRHTSYRLLNTSAQISIVDEKMQSAFEKHLAESHLIVVGYSGWNDLVMRTFKKNPHLLKGTLFWVPYESRNNIRNEVNKFLDDLPPSKAVILIDDQKPIDADSFMLRMCNFINEDNDGFLPYRKGILNYAARQHKFTLEQLKKHPSHDPNRILDLALEAQKNIESGQKEIANNKLRKAWDLAGKIDDIDEVVEGKAYIELGAAHIMLRQFEKGIESLEKATDIWKNQGYNNTTNTHRLKIFSLLGEAYYRMGLTSEALNNLSIARRIAKSGEREFVGYAHLLVAKLSLQQGRGLLNGNAPSLTKESLEDSKRIFENPQDKFGLALYYKESANILSSKRKFEDAEIQYEKAYNLFVEIDDQLGIANTLFGFGQTYVRSKDIDKAKINLTKANDIYSKENHLLGLANVKSAYGDIYKVENRTSESLNYYKEALTIYEELETIQGIELAKVEILKLEFEQLKIEEFEQRLKELVVLNQKTLSRYPLERRLELEEKLKERRILN